jgi:hypothetical protein
MSHAGYIRYDPRRPLVEAELSLGLLCDLFNEKKNGGGIAKKGELSIIPTVLDQEEADILNKPVGTPVFRLEYLVYDFRDTRFSWGWFTTLPEILTLKTRLGLWDESPE